MNGRVYDPALGRFLSVDPMFQFPTNTQSLNPYSYVLNNPLSLTDPSGYTSACPTGQTCPDDSGLKPGQTAQISYTPTGSHIATTVTATVQKDGSVAITSNSPAVAKGIAAAADKMFGGGTGNGQMNGSQGAGDALRGGGEDATSQTKMVQVSTINKSEGAASTTETNSQALKGDNEYSETVYGETGGIYPELKSVVNGNSPYTAAYNPNNWDPSSAADLTTAREWIAGVREANKVTVEDTPSDTTNKIEMRSWNAAVSAANGRDSVKIPDGVKFFFIRQQGTGPQGPRPDQWGPVDRVKSFGPFINQGGGDVPKGVNTYIDFYKSSPQ